MTRYPTVLSFFRLKFYAHSLYCPPFTSEGIQIVLYSHIHICMYLNYYCIIIITIKVRSYYKA